MTSSELVELKPCPFCGGEARMGEVVGEMPNFYPIVKCKACFNRGLPGNTEAEAIAKWNTRPDQPLLSATHYAEETMKRLQWAHSTTYKEDMTALFREVLAAENPLDHLRWLTSAYGTPPTSETE